MQPEELNQMSNTILPFTREIPGYGIFSVHKFNLSDHLEEIHRWVNEEYARFWGMSNMSVEEVTIEYQRILKSSTVYAGYYNQQFSFLIECYAPENDPVGSHYEVRAGDHGMHILVAPPVLPRVNFTWNVFTTVMEFMFNHLQVKRIVVEPDIRNEKIHVLNKKAGFAYEKQIELAEKSAYLAFCTQQQYIDAISLQQNQLALNS
jgi:hypothetical protein